MGKLAVMRRQGRPRLPRGAFRQRDISHSMLLDYFRLGRGVVCIGRWEASEK